MPQTITGAGGRTHVVMDPTKVAKFMRDKSGPVVRHLLFDGDKVKFEAQRIAPRKTGNMANHIVKRLVEIAGEPAVIVGIDGSVVPYALWVHEGSAAHMIYPRRAPRLVFFSQKAGRVIYMPVGAPVHHPGNRPNRYLVRALRVLHG